MLTLFIWILIIVIITLWFICMRLKESINEKNYYIESMSNNEKAFQKEISELTDTIFDRKNEITELCENLNKESMKRSDLQKKYDQLLLKASKTTKSTKVSKKKTKSKSSK